MIEQMTHVSIICKHGDKDALLRWLYGERGFHVMPLREEDDENWKRHFREIPDNSSALDSDLARVNSIVSFCRDYASDRPNFVDAMLPLKVVGTEAEIESAVEEVSIDLLHDKTSAMRSAIDKSLEKLAGLQNRKAALEQYAFLGDELPKLGDLKHFRLEIVSVPNQGGKAFLLDERIADGRIVAEELLADRQLTYFALAAPVSDAEALSGLIDDHGLHVQALPPAARGAKEELAAVAREIGETEAGLGMERRDANRFADVWLKKASLAAGHYESEKNLAVSRSGMSESSHLFVARGYVKTERLELFQLRMESRLPGATLVVCDPPAGEEEPPISLKWSKWISPAAVVVRMYGLPTYNGIDATPYVASIFFAFVGICLGDAAYGLALILIMTLLKRRYREQSGLRDFFQCFVYCGVATVVVGILTGSFMGDLSSMIPGMGWFDRIRTGMAVIDPIKDSQLALYIAVGIGAFTLMYGMALRIKRDLDRGDRMGAFSDGLLWLCFFAFSLLGGLTGHSIFWYLLGFVAVGLVFTQGRDQRSVLGKLGVGVVSLYGIVGAYGVSALLGDLISFARLMALCLTGAALGSTFNMLARLSTEIPYVGVILACFIIIGGHLMNFFLNLLGGFVHSARLIMLEFFGRFYDAGGYAYRPYGFTSSTVDIKRD